MKLLNDNANLRLDADDDGNLLTVTLRIRRCPSHRDSFWHGEPHLWITERDAPTVFVAKFDPLRVTAEAPNEMWICLG